MLKRFFIILLLAVGFANPLFSLEEQEAYDSRPMV